MLLFEIFLIVLLGVLLNNIQMSKLRKTKIRTVYIVGTALCFVVFPLLPVAISARYQSHVNGFEFISLPSVYFSYSAVSFLLSYIIWETTVRFRKKAIFIILVMTVIVSMEIQLMNHVFESRQKEGLYRVRTIERVFTTNIMSQFEGMEISAADLYDRIDALGFENDVVTDGYWTVLSRHRGHNITILNDNTDYSRASMFYMDEKMGGLVGIRKDNTYYIWADQKQKTPKAVKIGEDQYEVAMFDQYMLDSGMYIYSYLIIEDSLIPISGMESTIGSTWEEALKMANIYDDNFIGTTGDFVIRIGDTGKLEISLYCPFELSGGEELRIYINDHEMISKRVNSGMMKYTIQTDLQNEFAAVRIETNFARKPDNGDERELSLLICDVFAE